MLLVLLFHYLLLNMFRMLVHPSSGACDLLWIYFMCCTALVRCVLVLWCGSAGVVWYPYAGWGSASASTPVEGGRGAWAYECPSATISTKYFARTPYQTQVSAVADRQITDQAMARLFEDLRRRGREVKVLCLSHDLRFAEEHCCLVGSPASPICPSGKDST